jgi:3'-phosphoadenosine 5'-phosphosulfate sulfotransferase (PAPS reductase)/FAD synthetase
MKILDQHDNIALCLSGGKDSLVVLDIMKEYLHKITVIWCNTGSAFPETLKQMEHIKSIVPNFVEAISDNKADIAEHGMPSDIMPYQSSFEHTLYTSEDNTRLRPFYECCRNNIWEPMHNKILELGCTLVIKGQKNSDTKRAPINSGEWFQGIQYFFPLQFMTDKDVYDYINDNSIDLPDYYSHTDSSLDCWNCTAYLFESVGKLEYMKLKHKPLYDEVISNIRIIKEATKSPLKYIDRVLEYVNI